MSRASRKAARSTALAAPLPPLAAWQFHLLYATGFLLCLPLVAFARLGKQRERPAQDSIFAETRDEVMVALGIGFTA